MVEFGHADGSGADLLRTIPVPLMAPAAGSAANVHLGVLVVRGGRRHHGRKAGTPPCLFGDGVS